jgi:SAM-dependent methyltransferase
VSGEIVRRGYDLIAEAYAAQRDLAGNEPYIRRFIAALPEGASVLDAGCGSGAVDRWLADRGVRVVGIDISPKQIELAERLVPEGRFDVRDMLRLEDCDYAVDGVVSLYAIFHTRRVHHARLLRTFASFVPTGGPMLITMGAGEWEGIEADFHGVEMYWSHYGAETNRALIEAAGLSIELDEIDESGGERHQVVLARKTHHPSQKTRGRGYDGRP